MRDYDENLLILRSRAGLNDQCHALIAECIEEALRGRRYVPDDVLRGFAAWLQASRQHRQAFERLNRILEDSKRVAPIHGSDCRPEVERG